MGDSRGRRDERFEKHRVGYRWSSLGSESFELDETLYQGGTGRGCVRMCESFRMIGI